MSSKGSIRMNVPLMLSAPSGETLRADRASSNALVELIEAGDLTRAGEVPQSPVLRAVIDGFKASQAPDIDGRVLAAIDAVKSVEPDPRPDGTHAEPSEGDFRHMLRDTAEAGAGAGLVSTADGHPGGGDHATVATVTTIERLAGASGAQARSNSLAAVGAGLSAANPTLPITPPPMTAAELRLQIDALVERLAA